jgi:hypothetical protein
VEATRAPQTPRDDLRIGLELLTAIVGSGPREAQERRYPRAMERWTFARTAWGLRAHAFGAYATLAAQVAGGPDV